MIKENSDLLFLHDQSKHKQDGSIVLDRILASPPSSPKAIAEVMIQDIMDMFQDGLFDLDALASTLEEELDTSATPFQNVFFMECGRMNALVKTITTSLEVRLQGLLTKSIILLNSPFLPCVS